MDRVIIFIDNASIFKILRKKKIRIDFRVFQDILTDGSFLVATNIYVEKPKNVSQERQRYYNYLKTLGFHVRDKYSIMLRNGRKVYKGLSELMFQDIYDSGQIKTFSKAIVVTGDADAIKSINVLQYLNKKIEVWSFKKSLSSSLKKIVGKDHIYYIDSILNSIKQVS